MYLFFYNFSYLLSTYIYIYLYSKKTQIHNKKNSIVNKFKKSAINSQKKRENIRK